MKRSLNPLNSSDGLISMWAHSFDDDGTIEWQFQIVRRSGSVYLCMIYSWVDGSPSNCVAIDRDKILSLALYESCEAMNAAYDRYVEQRRCRRHDVGGLIASIVPKDATAHQP